MPPVTNGSHDDDGNNAVAVFSAPTVMLLPNPGLSPPPFGLALPHPEMTLPNLGMALPMPATTLPMPATTLPMPATTLPNPALALPAMSSLPSITTPGLAPPPFLMRVTDDANNIIVTPPTTPHQRPLVFSLHTQHPSDISLLIEADIQPDELIVFEGQHFHYLDPTAFDQTIRESAGMHVVGCDYGQPLPWENQSTLAQQHVTPPTEMVSV
jgi:hypothetical protein